jgi:DEAD/DEAH box helicase
MDSESTAPSLLETECSAAFISRKYNSEVTRKAIDDKFRQVCPGKIPHKWQVDVTKALLLGLDSIVIAGTGAGKTMLFVMPLLPDEAKTKMVLVISPLNELEAEQVSFLCPLTPWHVTIISRPKNSGIWALPQLLSMPTTIRLSSTRYVPILMFVAFNLMFYVSGHPKPQVSSHIDLPRDVSRTSETLITLSITRIHERLSHLCLRRSSLHLSLGQQVPQEILRAQQATIPFSSVSPFFGHVGNIATSRSL